MRKIQFDIINGTVEVSEFDTNTLNYGLITHYPSICRVLSHHAEGIVGAMLVPTDLFEKIDSEYGVTKL